MADGLRVQVATLFRSYAGSIDISELAGEIVHADRQRRGEIAATPHVIVDLGGRRTAGRRSRSSRTLR